MSHVPGRTEQDAVRFHHTTQNGTGLKTYALFIDLFIAGIFPLVFLDRHWPQVAEAAEHETVATAVPSTQHTRVLLLHMSSQ